MSEEIEKEKAVKKTEKKTVDTQGKTESKKESNKNLFTEKASDPISPLCSTNFSSDKIKVTLETYPQCRCKFSLTINPPLLTLAENKALKEISKQITMPGFRKGKIPKSVLHKKFPDAIEQETKKQLANIAFVEAQKISSIEILKAEHKISYDFDHYKPDNIQITYTFESEPHIPDITPESYTLKTQQVPEIDGKKIKSTLEQIRSFFAEFKEITDRKVQKDDFVTVSIDDLEQDPPTTVFTNTRFQMTPDGCAKWMRDLIIDRSIGDKIEGISEPNDDDTDDVKKDFKPKKVMIHIKEIKEATMPEIDDELAKKVGMADIASMKDKLKDLLENKEVQIGHEKTKNDLIKQLITNIKFELPATIIEKESNHRMNISFQNKDFLDNWKTLDDKEKEKKKTEVIQQAKESISIFYLCQKVVKDNALPLITEETPPMGTTLLDMMFSSKQQQSPPKDKKDPNYLSTQMLEKAQDFLIARKHKESS